MIAPWLQAAADAPLGPHANHREAEIRYIAERDRVCLLAAAMELWTRDRAPEPELAL
jgi:hypothetical protein